MKPTLIRLPISHYSKKIEWALTHAGIAYDTRDVWFRELVDFTHVNPENTVPVLETDDGLVCGSDRIMDWIAHEVPELDWFPEGAKVWQAWADETIGPLARHDAYRTLYANPTKYGHNPFVWLIARMGRGVILNILKAYKVRRYEESDAELRGPALAKVADQLRETGTGYLFGESPCAADFATAALLNPLLPIRDFGYPEHADWELLNDYVAGIKPKTLTRQQKKRASKADHKRWTEMPKITA